ncbi:MAG: cytidine deaminase [Caldisericaceae bacterium]
MKEKLIEEATKAMEHAYVPYSNFRVGAAVLMKSGKIYTGANIENSSYGATVCAERVAIFKAISEGETEIEEIAVVTETETPSSPCGICRQVIAEFSDNAKIILANTKGKVIETSLSELLPMAFTKKDLHNK